MVDLDILAEEAADEIARGHDFHECCEQLRSMYLENKGLSDDGVASVIATQIAVDAWRAAGGFAGEEE